MTCDQCRHQLLPLLYGLLEPLEREATAAHLESCPECQAALASARDQQGMLAEAVKEDHADIAFKVPAKSTPASPTLAMPRPRRAMFLLNRWAAAAAILLLLCGAGSVAGWSVWRDQSDAHAAAQAQLAKAKSDFDESKNRLDHQKGRTQNDIRAIQAQIDALFGDWKNEETKTRKVIEDQGAQLIIRGPQIPRAGANNNYEIELRQDQPGKNIGQQQANINQQQQQQDKNPNNLAGVKSQNLQMRVFNQKTQDTLLTQQVQVQGVTNQIGNFVLPSNLPIKPGDPIAMEFQTLAADGKFVTLTDNLNLVFPEYVTHLTTDRPLYRPGDTVRFRSLTLERFSLKPAPQKFHLRYRIIGPDNQELFSKEYASGVVAGPKNEPIRGPAGEDLYCFGAGEFALPANVVNGQYTLLVDEVNERFSEEKRTFLVQRSQPTRFFKEVEFHRTSYAAGDQVRMKVRVTPAQAIAGAAFGDVPLSARMFVDGIEINVDRNRVPVGDRWQTFECNLPPHFEKGIGAAIIECGEGEQRETLVRTIPLVVRDLQVDFFPEGGDLIAGAPNRVYFQARTPASRPAECAGRIIDEKGQEVARLQTSVDDSQPGPSQGLGYFTFIPQAKKRYRLKIDSPIGIERTFPLPEVKSDGVILHLPQAIAEGNIEVELMSVGQRRHLLVGAYCRGRMLDARDVRAGANQPISFTFQPDAGVGGVYRITVFEVLARGGEFRPLAERLIYRKTAEKLDISIKSDRARYLPGETVKLTLQARNEKQAFVPAVATLAVVDQGLLKAADEKTSRAMSTHFMLTTEVRNPEDLENVDVLLGDHPNAAIGLDLLLGCQGWRRFAEQNPQNFQRDQQQANKRQQANPVFIANTDVVTQFFETERKKIEKLDQKFVKQAIELEKKLAETEKHEDGPADLQKDVVEKQGAMHQTSEETRRAERRLRQVHGFLIQFGLGAALLALLFVAFYLVSIGLRKLSEGGGNARAWLTSGLGLFGLLFFASVLGTFALMGEKLIDDAHDDLAAPKPAIWVNLPQRIEPNFIPVDDVAAIAADNRPAEDGPMAAEIVVDRNKGPKPLIGAEPPVANARFQRDVNARGVLAGGQPEPAPVPNDGAEDRRLRQEGNYQALLLKNLGRRVPLPAVNDSCVVRVYAHQYKPQTEPAPRDRADTICWHPVLVMPGGQTEIQFGLTDAVTRFEVLVYGHTFDGRLGTNRIEIAAQLPFGIAPTVPAEISSNDQVTMPVALTNDRPWAGAANLSVRGTGIEIAGDADRVLDLKKKDLRRELFQFKPSIADGEAVLRIVGKTERNAETMERRIKVVPDGVPVTGSMGGLIENGAAQHEITLPRAWIPGSLKIQAHFFPTPIAEVQAAIDAFAGEPDIALEDSIARQMASALLLQFMSKQSQHANAILESRARQSLRASLARWTAPDAGLRLDRLSVQGVCNLRDLARVGALDPDLQELAEERLRAVKIEARDPASMAATVWALSESGMQRDLDEERTALLEQAKASKDPRFLTLVALSHLSAKQMPEGIALMQRVAALQKADGVVGAADRDLDIETTALAVLGWLKTERPGEFNGNLQAGVRWLSKQRRGSGVFGRPQTTVLALQALLAYQLKTPRELQSGDLHLLARTQGDLVAGNQEPAAEDRVAFSARSHDPVTLTLRNTKSLQPGKNVIQVNAPNNASRPYTLTWSYRTNKPANDANAPLKLSTRLSHEEAKEGETIKLTAVVENVSGKSQDHAVAVLGLPAGVAAPLDQLKAMQSAGKIATWELRGRDVVLSWRELPKGARIEFDLALTCRLPGFYGGPASRVYLLADAERAFWTEPLNVRIGPNP